MVLNDINKRTYEKIVALFKRYNRVGLEQCTGSGKGCIAVKWIEDNPTKKFFVLSSNSSSLFTYTKNNKGLDNVSYMLYSSLCKHNSVSITKLVSDFDYFILDEIHRTGAEVWQKGVNDLLFAVEGMSKKVLGLSATPVRFLDGARNMFNELKFEVIKGLSYQEMIDNGLSLGLEYHSIYYGLKSEEVLRNADLSDLNKSERTFLIEELSNTIHNNDSTDVPKLIKKAYLNGKCQKILCFFEDVVSAISGNKLIDNTLAPFGTVYIITGETPEKERDEILTTVNESTEGIHILKCVNILNEGLHIDGCTGSMFFRSTSSPNLYLQQLGRTIYMTTEIKPIVFDFVCNYEGIKGYLEPLSDYCISNKMQYSINTKSNDNTLDFVSIIIEDTPLHKILSKIDKLYKNSEIFSESEKNLLRTFYPTVKESCFSLFPGRDVIFLRKQVRELFRVNDSVSDISNRLLERLIKYCPYQGVSYIKGLNLSKDKYKKCVDIAKDKGVLRSKSFSHEIRNKLTAGVLEFGLDEAYKNVPELHPVVACYCLQCMGYKINKKYLEIKNDGWWCK